MKSKQFNFRLDLLTYLYIRDYAKYLNCSVTDLIVKSITRSFLVRIEQVSNVDRKFYAEMSGLANNLNQCTRALNRLAKQAENGHLTKEDQNVLQDINSNLNDIQNIFSKVSKMTGITEKGLYRYLKSNEYGTHFLNFLKNYDPYLFERYQKELSEIEKLKKE